MRSVTDGEAGVEDSDVEDDEPMERSIMDPIHGSIKLSPLLWSVIDTPHFQRLREIKQLGVSYRVFPGASHNRFEHCLGVAHLAGRLMKILKEKQPRLKITDRETNCVQLAGLCHDLGHGPWSHVWDNSFIPTILPHTKWAHEDASEMMFDHLVKANNIGLSQNDVNFIKDLIRGEPHCSKDKRPPEKAFLFDIVANKRNGIDVDKFDYIARDTKAIGDACPFEAERLLNAARVIDNEICYDIKTANYLFELCHMRLSLHKRIYTHKTARAIEYMIIDALMAAEPKLNIARRILYPEKYLHLTDNIMAFIKQTDDEDLAVSREIFKRIDHRDLYRCVDYKSIPWEFYDEAKERLTVAKIVKEAKAVRGTDAQIDHSLVQELSEDHVIVDICRLHFGMKDKNPIDYVRFYSKTNTKEAFHANPGDFSTLMPQCFGECLVRVFTRDPKFFGLIRFGYNVILDRLSADSLPRGELHTSDLGRDDNTEAPSTPRTLPSASVSRNTSFTSAFNLATPRVSMGGEEGLDYVDRTSPTATLSTPFTRNKFTEVPPVYQHKSPGRQGKRGQSGNVPPASSAVLVSEAQPRANALGSDVTVVEGENLGRDNDARSDAGGSPTPFSTSIRTSPRLLDRAKLAMDSKVHLAPGALIMRKGSSGGRRKREDSAESVDETPTKTKRQRA